MTVSLKKNAIFNVIKSLLSILFPFVTFYYASRVVGTDMIGRVSYGASIVSYFALLAVFGINTYAVRECAAIRDDKEQSQGKICELWTLSILTTLVSLVLLVITIVIVSPLRPYGVLILIQSLSIVFTTLGMDWVNAIYEDYKYITIRSLFINVINLIILFIFVRSPEDYYVYAFLSVLSTIIIGAVNFVYIRRYVTPKLGFHFDLRRYVRELMPFFMNEVSIAVYVSSDATILGLMKGDHEVGLYSAAVKIYTIVKSVFIAILTVALPRLSKSAAEHDEEGAKRVLGGMVSVFILLSLPAVTGLILYARQIILFVCGEEYLDADVSLKLLAAALLFAVFGGIVSRCVNIPYGYEKINTAATAIAAVENVVLNIPMIMIFGLNGAAFTTVLAEITVLVIGLVNLYRHREETGLSLQALIRLRDIRDAVAGTVFIVIIYLIVSRYIGNELIRLFSGCLASVIVYFLILLVCRNPVLSFKKGLNGLK